ncbi:MAG TPA: glycosyl hydrolase family 28-related protein [Candidatus Latescibacteria bacterium]|nr:glycosyl hydrolase family 28-related protein [Candidatus Latescibacterota bacterium]
MWLPTMLLCLLVMSFPAPVVAASVIKMSEIGAKCDGVTDDTVAFRNGLRAAGAESRIEFPAGTCVISDTITIAAHRQHIVGAGMHVTYLKFVPTAGSGKTLLKVQATPSGELFQGSIRDLAFGSEDRAFSKTGIEIVDASGFVVENVASYPWTGVNSIGIRTRGREFGLFRNLYLSADRPLVISDNPNHSIDIDHHSFFDCYFTANGNPVVEIESGVNLTHVTFGGAQAWVKGTHGLRWIDSGTSTVGIGLRIQNVRWEQAESSTGYFMDIEHNSNLLQLSVEHLYGGLHARGFKLRKVRHAALRTAFYDGTGEALNVDSSVYPLLLENSWFQTGSTVSTPGLTKVLDSGPSTFAGPLSALVLYDLPLSAAVAPTVDSIAIRDGAKVEKYLSAVTPWNPGPIVDGGVSATVLAVADARPGDPCIASYTGLGSNDFLLTCHVESAGLARVVLLNKTGRPVQPPMGTLRVDVW